MTKQLFLPELLYSVDSGITRGKLEISYSSKKPVTGKVTKINLRDRFLTVSLGGNFISYMTFEEATIYPIYKPDNSISPAILSLLNKRIQVQILKIKGNNITVSRRINMLNALDYFKKKSKIKYAAIVGFNNLSAFIDIGAGLSGKILARDLSPVLYHNPKDLGLHRGDIISVNVLEYLPDSFFFTLARNIPKAEESIKNNDLVRCKVFDKVDNDPLGIGYYVLINKAIKGIVDSEFIRLKYGDKILAQVRQLTKKGPKLDIVKKL